MKLCKGCGVEKSFEEFYRGNCKGGTSYWCKSCQIIRTSATRQRANSVNPGAKHGLLEEEYWGMIFLQDNRCANQMCRAENPTHIDHDHSHCPGKLGCSRCVRGILCHRCNTMLGFYERNKEKFLGALRYVEGPDSYQGAY